MRRLLDVDRRQPRAGTVVLCRLHLARCLSGRLCLQLPVRAGVFVGAVEDASSEGDFDQGGDCGDAGGDVMVLDSMLVVLECITVFILGSLTWSR